VTAAAPATTASFADDPTLQALLQQLQARLGNRVCCTLVYGSCLRSGDIYDGLLDLYLLCDNYADAYRQRRLAVANWLLPPNVFYAQQAPVGDDADQPTLRSKVTVISLRDFERGCSPAWFESYLWGRFAQPTALLQVRDEPTRKRVEQALHTAAYTLLRRTLPVLPAQGSITALWQGALAQSYATELRTERSGRAQELAESAVDYYTAMTREHAGALDLQLVENGTGAAPGYAYASTAWQRGTARAAWLVRRVQGKLLSILRLVKALFTFEGGLDYIAWKLERHSGEKIEIPDKVRRRPLIHLWAFFWGLYRRGIFK
jgi:hypothetical protein